MMQFAFISLIPGLIRNLQDCADPQFSSYEETLVMPTSLRTSERSSRKWMILLLHYLWLTVSSSFLYGTASANF